MAIVGPPNVGKSTLLNALVGEKLAIVSPKPQTTRNRLRGIRTAETSQLVFIDTPGLNRFPRAINKTMNREAVASLEEVDAVCFVTDVGLVRKFGPPDIPAACRRASVPLVVVLNKIDTVPRPELLPLIAAIATVAGDAEIVPVSARKGTNIDDLVGVLERSVPEGPPVYAPDELTTASLRYLVGELVREQVFLNTGEEIPYSVAVLVEEFTERRDRGLTVVKAAVMVERASQKGILIGKGGSMIGRIGTAARVGAERLLGTRVALELTVRVEPGWTGKEGMVRRLGGFEGG